MSERDERILRMIRRFEGENRVMFWRIAALHDWHYCKPVAHLTFPG